MDVRLKRADERASAEDGYRVPVDQLWPRGVSRKQAKLDEWEKELSPSSKLREWFGHDPFRFPEFRRRYIDELRAKGWRLRELRRHARVGTPRSSTRPATSSTTTPSSSPRCCGVVCRHAAAAMGHAD